MSIMNTKTPMGEAAKLIFLEIEIEKKKKKITHLIF